jgi:Ni,Fe-hydrogenase III small subunit
VIKVYRINTGSCGGSDAEIEAAISANGDIGWAESPHNADVLLLTGPLTSASRPAFLALWQELAGRVALLAVGRCAIDGHPFGRGGVAELPDVRARKLDGCPPAPKAIVEAIRAAVKPDKETSR